MKGLRPIDLPSTATPQSVTARTYETLRAQIVSGSIAPGTLLSESQVAASLGVSRTPLREALRALLGDGLLEEGPNRQVRVRVLPSDASTELTEILRSLMSLTLDPVSGSVDPEEVDHLRLIAIRIRRAVRARDLQALLDEEDSFLLQLAHASGRCLLEENLRRILGQARLAAVPHRPLQRGIQLDGALDELADCLESGDLAGARRAFSRFPFRLLRPSSG